MKVRMNVTVELDPEVWASEYGLNVTEVRADVREKISTDLHSLLVESLSIAKTVTVT